MKNSKFNLVLFAIGIFIFYMASAYLIRSRGPSKLNRSVASVRPTIKYSSEPLLPVSTSKLTINKPDSQIPQPEESVVDLLTKSHENDPKFDRMASIRSKLKPETLAWSEKFPKPENILEEKFLIRLMVAYDLRENMDITELVPRDYPGWRNAIIPIEVYMEKCAMKIDPYGERDLKNFVFWFWLNQRPGTGLQTVVSKQLEVYFEAPTDYSQEQYHSLRDLIALSQMFEDQSYSILDEMKRVRE